MLCPKDEKPCCDDLCYSGGCLLTGTGMLESCGVCGGQVDTDMPELSTCECSDEDEW